MATPFGIRLSLWIGVIMTVMTCSETKSIDTMISDSMMTDDPTEMMRGSSPNSVLLELDVMMTRESYLQMMSGSRSRKKKEAIGDMNGKWRNNVIPYQFAPGNFSKAEIAMIRAAMDTWERYSCITFRPEQEEDSNVVGIFKGMGCWSYVGRRIREKYQMLSLAPGCFNPIVILHEFAHLMGIYHEQSRPDRDEYVTINEQNIITGEENNFMKRISALTFGVDYDYRSIMHYGRNYFSRNREEDTITTRDPAYQTVIGNRGSLEYSDVAVVNKLYQCSSKCNKADTCERTFGRPAFLGKDCTCWCHLYWMYH